MEGERRSEEKTERWQPFLVTIVNIQKAYKVYKEQNKMNTNKNRILPIP